MHAKHIALHIVLMFGIMFSLLSRALPARADYSDIMEPGKGKTIVAWGFSGTDRFISAQLFQLNYLHGFGIGQRGFLFSYEAGIGVAGLFSGEEKVRSSLDASASTLVMLTRPAYACHTHAIFWANGVKLFALGSGNDPWPMYIGPSLGITMMSKVHHDICYQPHDWSSGQDTLITNISYMALWNANRQNTREGTGHGLSITFSW